MHFKWEMLYISKTTILTIVKSNNALHTYIIFFFKEKKTLVED